jgi:hypothetical protein
MLITIGHGFSQSGPAATECFAWRFLGVLRALAVNLRLSINRQDAKNAKNRQAKSFPGGVSDFENDGDNHGTSRGSLPYKPP